MNSSSAKSGAYIEQCKNGWKLKLDDEDQLTKFGGKIISATKLGSRDATGEKIGYIVQSGVDYEESDKNQFSHILKEAEAKCTEIFVHVLRPKEITYRIVYPKSKLVSQSLKKNATVENLEPRNESVQVKSNKTKIGHKSFPGSSQLKVHGKCDDRKSNLCCPICGKTYPTQSKLSSHLNYHKQEKLFKCKFCDKAFSLPLNAKVHMRSHTGETPYDCHFCSKSFSQIGNLNVHLKIHKKRTQSRENPGVVENGNVERDLKDQRKHQDSVKSLPSSTVLKKSIKKRLNLHNCPICSKSFYQLIHLTEHMNDHNVRKPYKCPKCPKAFSSPNVLKRHLGIHALLNWNKNDNDVTL